MITSNLYATASVRSDGCILIGKTVSCDGFEPSCPIRVQTNIHSDYLLDFDSSKGAQEKIVLSQASYDLLVAEFNADLKHRRRQFKVLPTDGSVHEIMGVKIQLFPACHTLGSVMPLVTTEEEMTVLYSSSFSWPTPVALPNKVDVLIVNATYGNPSLQRGYKKSEVIDRLIELIQIKWLSGSVIINGHRDRLQYVMSLISGQIDAPFLVSPSVYKTLTAYMHHQGFNATTYCIGSLEANSILASKEKFVGFIGLEEKKESLGFDAPSHLYLSAFMVPGEEPVLLRSDGVIQVALTDHADFLETITLINQVQPRLVIADGSRGGNADALAEYVRNKLNIEASSELHRKSAAWGGAT